jgi:predicted ATPase
MLQRLPPDTYQLLSLAAVQGYEFDSATLARVSGSAPTKVGPSGGMAGVSSRGR